MELKEAKNNLFLLTIVAIVAIVAIVIMIASTGSKTYNTENYVGQAAKATARAEFVTEGKLVKEAVTAPSDTELECTDTDGLNYYTLGTVIFTNESDIYNYTDYCDGNTTLYEGYCIDSTPSIRVYDCPYACSGGRCINQTTSYDLYAQDILIQGAYDSKISINTDGKYNYVYDNSQVIIKPQVTNTGNTAINAYNFFNMITFGSEKNTKSTYTRCSSSNFWINPGITFTCNSDNVVRTLIAEQSPYTISIDVDYYNNIAETNENNNAHTEIIYVYPIDSYSEYGGDETQK